MLEQLAIVERDSGVPIFVYSPTPGTKELLHASFLSALQTFCVKEIGEPLKFFGAQNRLWYFHYDDRGYMYICVVPASVSPMFADFVCRAIADELKELDLSSASEDEIRQRVERFLYASGLKALEEFCISILEGREHGVAALSAFILREGAWEHAFTFPSRMMPALMRLFTHAENLRKAFPEGKRFHVVVIDDKGEGFGVHMWSRVMALTAFSLGIRAKKMPWLSPDFTLEYLTELGLPKEDVRTLVNTALDVAFGSLEGHPWLGAVYVEGSLGVVFAVEENKITACELGEKFVLTEALSRLVKMLSIGEVRHE